MTTVHASGRSNLTTELGVESPTTTTVHARRSNLATDPYSETRCRNPRADQWLMWPGVLPSSRTSRPARRWSARQSGSRGTLRRRARPCDSGHLVQSVSRTLDMLEDLERTHAVERPVVERQLVRRRRGEREQCQRPYACHSARSVSSPRSTPTVVTPVRAGETLGHDALAAPDVENRAGSKRVDRFVDLAQKALEERARHRVPARVLVGGIARRPDEVRRVDGIAGAQRRTSSTICSIRSRSSRRSSCCDVISSESRPSDTNWIPTTTSSTPSVRSGRCPIASPQNHSTVR